MEIGETLLVTSRQEWREWLAQHHADRKEIWLVYYKKGSGKAGISYEESVEEALCFGWIDGTNKGIDGETYAGRFTPRRPRSPWAASNRARVARLLQEGRMTEAGLAVLPGICAKFSDDVAMNRLPKLGKDKPLYLSPRQGSPTMDELA